MLKSIWKKMTWHVSNSVRFWSKSENLTGKSNSDPNLHHFRNSHFSWFLPNFWHFCQERLEEIGQIHFISEVFWHHHPPPFEWNLISKGEKAHFEFIWYGKQYLAPSLHFAQIVSSSSDSSSAVRWNMQAWDHTPLCRQPVNFANTNINILEV